MIIREVIWLRQFADKIERKHHVSQAEVDEALAKQPPVRRMRRGAREGEDLYRAIGQTDAGRYLSIFFIYKGEDEHWLFARESDSKELRSYAKHKK